MPINKGEIFSKRDVYIDCPFEEVMYRWDHLMKQIFVCFYGEAERHDPVPYDNRLFNHALLNGEEITRQQYEDRARRT